MIKNSTNVILRLFDKLIIQGNESTRNKYLGLVALLNSKGINARKKTAKNFKAERNTDIPREIGFQVLNTPHEFEEVYDIVKIALELTSNNVVEKLRSNKKAQLLTGLLPKEDITLNSPFLKLALREDLIKTISRYLGFVPILSYVDVWYSKPSKALANSQLFHCDWASKSQIKVFIYATDVSVETGPLVLIPANKSEQIRKNINYRYGNKVHDSLIESHSNSEEHFKIIASRGSIVLADTSRCFHYGSRVNNDAPNRVLAILQYISPIDFEMIGINKGKYSHLADDSLSDLQKSVLNI